MDNNKKICVYAICKNEIEFVDKWLDNVSEADYIVVLDTGSTDGTYEKLKADPRVTKVAQKEIKPWRFDVARNESMKLIPEDADICVSTDFDELFDKGWANLIRSNWRDGTERMFYKYYWGQTAAGYWHDVFRADKVHVNNGNYYWKYPVHEVLMTKDDQPQNVIDLSEVLNLWHHQDKNKANRRSYLDLLALGAHENPNDPHIRSLYAREFLTEFHIGKPENIKAAVAEYLEILKLPVINNQMYVMEKLHTLLQLALIYCVHYADYDNAIKYSLKFLKEDQTYRDPYLVIIAALNAQKLYVLAESIAEAAEKNTYQHYTWIERQNTFLDWLPSMKAELKYGLGKYEEALAAIKEALKFAPNSSDLKRNMELIQSMVDKDKQTDKTAK